MVTSYSVFQQKLTEIDIEQHDKNKMDLIDDCAVDF